MKIRLKIILVLFIIGLIATVLVYLFIYNKSHPDYENMKPAYTLSAADLYNAFKANKTDSEKKYSGQIIEINGKLAKVESTDSLVIAVFVFNQGMFGDEGIRCTMLPEFDKEAKKLQSDNLYYIKGYCTGYNDSDVILEHCSVIK